MAWIELGYYRGWHIHWDAGSHRMYAKEGGLLGSTYHFSERPNDRATAFATAKLWVDSR
ncbi:MAG: hypothetical protein JO056_11875 [Alphaproteobacteria bacterium]|jgi:hypothetical protein|nr:hypothetical protein [Alphaproteobacteria bacterium]